MTLFLTNGGDIYDRYGYKIYCLISVYTILCLKWKYSMIKGYLYLNADICFSGYLFISKVFGFKFKWIRYSIIMS